MSDVLKLAEAYYTVARDLEWRAASMHEMGKNLYEIADHLCEQNIRNTASEPDAARAAASEEPAHD